MLKFLAGAAAVGYAAKKGYTKKLGKGLGIAGALFFASGLGVSGFNAFRNTDSLGDFLGAVGQTTMAGAQGLLGSIGIGSGVSPSLAKSIGIEEETTLFGGSTGIFGAGAGSVSQETRTLDQHQSVNSSILSKAFGGLQTSGAIKSAQNRQIMMSAIQTGAQAYLANRQFKRKEEQRARLNFFGDRARGGSSELSFGPPSVMSNPDETNDDRNVVSTPPTPSPFDESEEGEDNNDQSTLPSFMRGP